jgi:hypothetical protein
MSHSNVTEAVDCLDAVSNAPDAACDAASDAASDGARVQSNWGRLRRGDREPALGVTIAEILHRDTNHLIFLDERCELQWLCNFSTSRYGWIYGRVVALEAKCDFFREAEQPMYALVWGSMRRGYTKIKNTSKTQAAPLEGGRNDNAGDGEAWNTLKYLPDSSYRTAKLFIGQGLVAAFTGSKDEDIEAAFESAEKYIEQRGREASLGWLYNVFIVLAVIAAIGFFICISVPAFDRERSLWLALTCASAGGVGAYLSRAFASRTALPCDANAGWWLHVMEACLRWSVGAAAGALIGLLVKSKVLLGTMETGDRAGLSVVIAFAVLAGMSERFLPTLLSRFDDQLEIKKKEEGR